MFTTYTYQDWLAMGGGGENARKIVNSYRASDFFRAALDATRYYNGDNPTLDDKYLLRISTTEATDAFQSTHPLRGATARTLYSTRPQTFQSTHPLRGATRQPTTFCPRM